MPNRSDKGVSSARRFTACVQLRQFATLVAIRRGSSRMGSFAADHAQFKTDIPSAETIRSLRRRRRLQTRLLPTKAANHEGLHHGHSYPVPRPSTSLAIAVSAISDRFHRSAESFNPTDLRNGFGNLAMFTAMRRAYAIRNFFDTCARV
jgi:hypothetical protein